MGCRRSIGLGYLVSVLLLSAAPVQAGAGSAPLGRVAPVEVRVPRFGIQAAVVPVGEEPDGAMAAPADPDAVGWWSLGYGTGEPGNLVLAGHVDWGKQPRVFSQIHRLEAGDEVIVLDALAREYRYQVVWVKQVAAEGADVGAIFAGAERQELTLITCGGQFDPSERMYQDRIIVRAEQS
jgi:LPXTG-site transpeptidase (sortase) family protein